MFIIYIMFEDIAYFKREMEWQKQCLVTLYNKLNMELPEQDIPKVPTEHNSRKKTLETFIDSCEREQHYSQDMNLPERGENARKRAQHYKNLLDQLNNSTETYFIS